MAGVTDSNGDVRPVPVADALEYMSRVLAVGNTAAVAEAFAELRHDFAWAKVEDVVAAAMARLAGRSS